MAFADIFGITQLINIINKKLAANIEILCDLGHFSLVYKLAKTPILILWICDMDSPGVSCIIRAVTKRVKHICVKRIIRRKNRMASLSLKNVTKKYPNGFVAVKEFNLEIADKEFIIFVGPSGCGKSTTLRMIAGLEDISSGELYIDDKLVNDVEPKDRDIAMVFQNYALYPHMSVYDNMAFGLKLRKTPKDEIDKKVHDAAKILDLEHLLDRKPKALSAARDSVLPWDVPLSAAPRYS